jgi:hypothetical protein
MDPPGAIAARSKPECQKIRWYAVIQKKEQKILGETTIMMDI